jgi:Tfp pilus assembly protein PilF
MGSVTEKVLQAMPCSVITVKEEPVVQVQFDAEIKDLQEHLDRGRQLFEKGLAREALHEFQRYVTKAPTSIPAWEAMAAVHERLGNTKECEECQHRAEQIRDSLWQKMVQSEARRDHPLWSRKTFR